MPDDTWFIPAVHNTSLDEVTLLDREQVPASHHEELKQLQVWLDPACRNARAERAASLGLPAEAEGRLEKQVRHRSRDWSEVRPEWGLARNAAFVAAPRYRTQQVNLQGRVFLHEYDRSTDPDGAILALILSAPMVVASWINLQYYASTVDNGVFGGGTKTLHNRVGSLGVVLGNGGDLRTGLPWESVTSPGGAWFHEPLRLQVLIEDTCERIDAALANLREVRELIEHGWARLYALDTGSMRIWERRRRDWVETKRIEA